MTEASSLETAFNASNAEQSTGPRGVGANAYEVPALVKTAAGGVSLGGQIALLVGSQSCKSTRSARAVK
jgi:hypothetical protein